MKGEYKHGTWNETAGRYDYTYQPCEILGNVGAQSVSIKLESGKVKTVRRKNVKITGQVITTEKTNWMQQYDNY